MCLQHWIYWQCCGKVDTKYIDFCPFGKRGQSCPFEARQHPISGYCPTCRKEHHKLEDDVVEDPWSDRNDSFDRPWEPQRRKSFNQTDSFDRTTKPSKPLRTSKSEPVKYKPIKSQPLHFPGYTYGPPEPERGRRLTRSPQPGPSEPVDNQSYSVYYNGGLQTPPSSDDDYKRRKALHRRRSEASGDYADQFTEHVHSPRKMMPRYVNVSPSPSPEPPQHRLASPATIQRLQIPGSLSPSKDGKWKQNTDYFGNVDAQNYRVASPHTVRKLEKQGVIPPMKELELRAAQATRKSKRRNK